MIVPVVQRCSAVVAANLYCACARRLGGPPLGPPPAQCARCSGTASGGFQVLQVVLPTGLMSQAASEAFIGVWTAGTTFGKTRQA